jgi:diguanylate cyclase
MSSCLKDVYKIKLYELYQGANTQLMTEIFAIVEPEAETIAQHFYRRMLNYDHALKYLTHHEVKTRLQAKMTEWIKNLFLMKHSDKEIDEHIDRQIQVGNVHARIGLPISLVSYGMTIIKDNICALLINTDFSREKLSRAIMLMDGLIDSAYALINESYIGHTVVGEKNVQAFRLHVSGHNLAFDCERLRSSLLDWLRQVLIALHQNVADLELIAAVTHSDFGLWVTHKGNLILGDRYELQELLSCLQKMDKIMQQLVICKRQRIDFTQEMNHLSESVSKATWLLSNISKEIVEIDSGRDVLTKLFNRRYLETVMRHETEFSIRHGLRFAMIYVDIDHFKSINDRYGHESGDVVLSQMAEILLQKIRASDFVFRMGGEEFLCVLSDVTQKNALQIAEQIRAYVELNSFELPSSQKLNMTVSLGVALHDGHPDYAITMNKADEALYFSKHNGRNQVTFFGVNN